MSNGQNDMVGSHGAGASTYRPLIEQAIGRMLAAQAHGVQQAAHTGPKRICFVGLENRSSEELGDFHDEIVVTIENCIAQTPAFMSISRRFVDAGLRQMRVRPDELMRPDYRRAFCTVMEQQGQPFDYLLFATLTSGTTRNNSNTQRDYQLSLELVNIHTGVPTRESARIRKSYHRNRVGALLSR